MILLFLAIVFISSSTIFAADNNSNNNSNNITSIEPIIESNSVPKTLSQSSIINAANSVRKHAIKNKKLPDSVKISGHDFSMPEFTYLLSKTIDNQQKKSNSSVTVKYNVKNPNKPSGTNIKTRINSKNYIDYAKRTIKFIDKNNQVPNFISVSKNSRIQYQTAVFMFSTVLSNVHSKKKLPSHVNINIKNSHAINKYIPNHLSSSGVNKVSSNDNAIWIQAHSFNSVNFNTLARSGIGNIFLHDRVFSQYGNSAVNNWIRTANNHGIEVHIWMQAFFENGKWVNPINTNTRSYNQAHFNKLLSKIRTYSRMSNIAGIHLDYLRYPGTAYKFSYSNGINGEKAVTEFTRQASNAMRSINPRLILSAAVMPETNSNARYYGQNIPVLGKYLDVISPMIYKGNYRKDHNWIRATSNWFVKNSGGAKIWGGIQTYASDNDLTILSTSKLRTDSRAVMQGGAAGVALFRWGLTRFIDFSSI